MLAADAALGRPVNIAAMAVAPLLLLLICNADALLSASPDFQTKLGYALPPPGGANLSTASKANAQKYNTLSLVLEQPFKDTTGVCTLTADMYQYVKTVIIVMFCLEERHAEPGAGAALQGHHRWVHTFTKCCATATSAASSSTPSAMQVVCRV